MNTVTNTTNEQQKPQRQIRSFVRRQGRLTQKQENAILEYWSEFGIEYQAALTDFAAYFGRIAPLTLEIGFGMGTSLVKMAKAAPEKNFLGIEVHRPGVGACIALAKEEGVDNLRVICHDAIDVLDNMIADASLDAVQLFFPDPWQKVRHHKRRIINPTFVQRVRKKLNLGSVIHLATDWQDYAAHMLAVMNQAEGFQNISTNNTYIPRPDSRPLTKFELRGQRLGHNVWDLMFKKVK